MKFLQDWCDVTTATCSSGNDHIPQIKLGGRTLDYVSSYRYLGCIISDVLTDELDIKRTIRGIYTRSNILIRKFNFCSFTVKQQLFQSYCTNFYCTQLWYKYSAASLNKIRVAFNNSCRHFYRLSQILQCQWHVFRQ